MWIKYMIWVESTIPCVITKLNNSVNLITSDKMILYLVIEEIFLSQILINRLPTLISWE